MTTEETINELKTKIAVMEKEIEHLRTEHKELHTDHKNLQEKHEKLNDEHGNHKSRSQVLHAATPILTIIAGLAAYFLKRTPKAAEGKEKPSENAPASIK